MIARAKHIDVVLAEAAGVTRRTVQNDRDKGFVGETPEEYVAWREANLSPYARTTRGQRSVSDMAASELDEQEQRAKIAKLQQEEREKRLKNDEREGRLLDRDDVELCVAELTGMIRMRLEAMPNELESEWPAEVRALVTERLRDKIHLALTEMSHWRLGH